MNPFIKSLGIGILGSALVTAFLWIFSGEKGFLGLIIPPAIFTILLVFLFLRNEKYKNIYDKLKIIFFLILGVSSYYLSVLGGIKFTEDFHNFTPGSELQAVIVAGILGIIFFYIGFTILYFRMDQQKKLNMIFVYILISWIIFGAIILTQAQIDLLPIQFFWQTIVLTGSAYIIHTKVKNESNI